MDGNVITVECVFAGFLGADVLIRVRDEGCNIHLSDIFKAAGETDAGEWAGEIRERERVEGNNPFVE